ncbi:NAD/FAD-utilizing enzyme [Colwellia sp. C1TZA3]|uniref:NAD/FAD-utilizing enzyme n=1 Tax=Colwellia sp. C1TZA3 TaxID=2508879 RepID=UPI0011BA350E|nr:NAD/FAD-utilizing enzyme [Colwellia sp. C1TZA3]TWX73299.1 NAD/FAD-utilizing enzyme [Colwellia sp. C1TZA3]
MIRHFYVIAEIDEVEKVEKDLKLQGFTDPQIHVLSENDTEVETHNLHAVESVLKKNVVHSTKIGAIYGIIGAIITLFIAYGMGWTESTVGWIPFVFLSIIVLGFCTWEGGLIGIQTPNVNFVQFKEMLDEGKHILFVDVGLEQEIAIASVMKMHPNVQIAGIGKGTPHWVVRAQDKFKLFMKVMP